MKDMKKIIFIILIIIVAIAPIIIIHAKNDKAKIKEEKNSNSNSNSNIEIESNSNVDSNIDVDSNSNTISNSNSTIKSNSNSNSNVKSNSNSNSKTKSNSNVTKKSNSNSNSNNNKKLNLRNFNVDIDNVDNLMIVAHPDDETIFGGSHLIDDDYLVVCVTCGVVERRVHEFETVMNLTNEKYIMLSYPDKTNGKRDTWDSVRDKITIDLERIMNMKKWKTIVTHNKTGEYGHQHHKMTHAIVTSIYEKEHKDEDNLYYFGTYYDKNKIKEVEDTLDKISDENYEKKKKTIDKYYPSQSNVYKEFGHIYRYEKFEKYTAN